VNTITYQEIRELINRANQLKHDLMKAGLFQTYHAMDEVTKAIGWEASEIMAGKHPTKLLEGGGE
jgi:hypothetical protein